MPISPHCDSGFPAAPSGAGEVSRRREELAYQAATVAAILLLLGSIWLF